MKTKFSDMENSFSLIMPAYKEEEYIEDAINGLLKSFRVEKLDFEIIVVIDKIPDDKTYGIVKTLSEKNMEIEIIVRNGKRGIAKAIIDGVEQSSKDVIIFVMAENSQESDDILKMAKKMNEGYDMVFGSRFLENKKLDQYPLKKYICNRLCNYALNILFGIRSNDITNGIKAYKSEILKKMKITSSSFEIFVEIPILAYKSGYKNFVEIPINYHGRKMSFSKFNLKNEAPKYFKIFLNNLLVKK